ncbi:MAG: MopE-related protein, partial [Actinomycetota bacterium]
PTLTGVIPANMSLVTVTPPAGWSCAPPSGGQFDCTAPVLAESDSAIFTIIYQVAFCTGNVGATHTVSVSSEMFDPVSADNTSSLMTSVIDTGFCNDGDVCTEVDVCVGAVCVGGPPPSEVCDGIDNDCDGMTDEDNPGGGAGCDTGELGICSLGRITCQGGQLECAQRLLPRPEICNDTDDDCDGAVDEGNPEGGASCGTGLPGVCASGTTTCQAGAVICLEDVMPSPEVCDNLDNDCDGTVDGYATSCGAGACAAAGTCAAGADSCTPGAPAAGDATCDGADDDCDGVVDEDYVPVPTSCGVGACAENAGVTSCVSGSVQDSCDPLAGAGASDATCDGVDEDCDGTSDEDYVSVPTTCGVGACSGNTGVTSCVAGAVEDSCDPLGGAVPDDATCDGVDEDCDGASDEDYVSVPT